MMEQGKHHAPAVSRRAVFAVLIVGLVIACLLDMPVFRYVRQYPQSWVHKDPGNFFRGGGYLPTWLVVAAAIVLHDRARLQSWAFEAWRRGGMVAASATFAGVIAEVTKLLFRRERGNSSHVWYAFRPLWDRPLFNGGLSLPSSHTMVAFGAAFMLCRLFPGARPVLLGFAVGTAVVRTASGAHFVSDVYVAALFAWPAAWLTGRLFDRLAEDRSPSVSVSPAAVTPLG